LELRERVLEAMRVLDYQPNRLARSLRSGKTHTFGIIVSDNTNPFFAEIIRGIEDTSFEHGYSLILCNSDTNLAREKHYIDLLTEKQVDGILFMAAGDSADHLRALQDRQFPVVVVDREIADIPIDTVLADNVHGAWLATQHLIDLGHQRIGCITAPASLPLSADRIDGYRKALLEADIVVEEDIIVPGNFNLGGGYRATQRLLALDNPPTAVFSANDLMAIGAICAASEAGRNVPTDLSVVGFDDIPLASYSNPPLTTVTQPIYDMGVAATAMLLERLSDPDLPPRRKMLPTELKQRRSTTHLDH
jgi:LacI family transcriptional regulator